MSTKRKMSPYEKTMAMVGVGTLLTAVVSAIVMAVNSNTMRQELKLKRTVDNGVDR